MEMLLQQIYDGDVKKYILASLLQLRGFEASSSPLVDEEGNVLAFNGEIYEGLNFTNERNDAKALFTSLTDPSQSENHHSEYLSMLEIQNC